jgi:peroxiredoxin
MERLYRRLAGEAFELVAISVDEDVEPVREFQQRMGLTFPILLDPSQEISRRYQTTGYPESFLIDREGRIATQRFVGPRDWSDPSYVALVERLLE